MSTESVVAPPLAPETRALLWKRAAQLGAMIVLQAVVLLLGSGRPGWAAGWVYLVTYVPLIALTVFVVRDPELFAERARIPKDAKAWDKVLSVLAGACGQAILAVAALEDRTLRNELAGYSDYAARVRYRLLPGVW